MRRTLFVRIARHIFAGKPLDPPRANKPVDPRIAFVQWAMEEWQRRCEMGMDYWELHDEPPTSAYIWRLQALQGAHNAAEADAMNKARSDMDNANGSHTTTSRS